MLSCMIRYPQYWKKSKYARKGDSNEGTDSIGICIDTDAGQVTHACARGVKAYPLGDKLEAEMSDKIGIVALRIEPTDTNEAIVAMKEELGLITLPMGLDVGFWSLRWRFYICIGRPQRRDLLPRERSITEKNVFFNLFSVYSKAGCSEPVLLERIPE